MTHWPLHTSTKNPQIDQDCLRLLAVVKERTIKGFLYCRHKPGKKNLTDKQVIKLTDLLPYDLKTVRAYRLKENSQAFW